MHRLFLALLLVPTTTAGAVLSPNDFRRHIEAFNRGDDEPYLGTYPNAVAWDFLSANVPLFSCPDPDVERTYDFRWWAYRQHVRRTDRDETVVTEFLPDVPWAGKGNAISCAAAMHLREGRWLRDRSIVDEYLRFWLREGGAARSYSFPVAAAAWDAYLARGDPAKVIDLLPDLIRNYRGWEHDRRDASGLFWQSDDRDGMEISAGGHGYRPTINSYMYADARAIAAIARLAGDAETAKSFDADADRIRSLVQQRLWSDRTLFFHTQTKPGLPTKLRPEQAGIDPMARELIGYVPWLYELPEPGRGYEAAWAQLTDPAGFAAPFGPTTVERRSPLFRVSYAGHECQWNGPAWPFATSQTLTALANVVRDYPQTVVDRRTWFDGFLNYTASQRLRQPNGVVVPWIDEDQDPFTGTWIARAGVERLHGIPQRGKDYNHSTYADLVITGLCGLVPRADDVIEVNPLLPAGTWAWFCLDGVPYHGRSVTIVWDRDGTHFGRGVGLTIEVDGKAVARSDHLARTVGPAR